MSERPKYASQSQIEGLRHALRWRAGKPPTESSTFNEYDDPPGFMDRFLPLPSKSSLLLIYTCIAQLSLAECLESGKTCDSLTFHRKVQHRDESVRLDYHLSGKPGTATMSKQFIKYPLESPAFPDDFSFVEKPGIWTAFRVAHNSFRRFPQLVPASEADALLDYLVWEQLQPMQADFSAVPLNGGE